MNIQEYLTIFISAVFIYNVILSRFLGLCSFIAISKETKPALAMSSAVMFVIVIIILGILAYNYFKNKPVILRS